jgi:hypothetical protein
MVRAWNQLTGEYLPQGYYLEKCLGEDDGGALYLTSCGPPAESAEGQSAEGQAAQPAVLKLVAGHSAAAGQLAAWERLAGLSHPSLLALLDCGRAGPIGPAGGHFLYAVFEYPDDHLASALGAGPLSESDARDVLVAVEAGLQFLHVHGLAHTSVDPRHIVAVGDRIKLSSYTVKPLAPGATEAADWKACSALRESLLGGPQDSTVDAAEPAPEGGPEPEATPPAIAVETSGPVDAPVTPLSGPERHRGLPLWGYALATMLVFVLLIALRRNPAPPPQPAPYVPAQAPQALVPTVQKARLPSLPAVSANWRVVAYTYMRRKDAEHKVEQINAKFPGFVPEVFSPKGGGQPPYLVALGGRTTRAQAQTLQREALSKGMPRGTYIQNFSN